MRVSVAMCTYNGAKYIREQLDSIIHQTLPVDEIIISDDGSSDDTVSILRKYAEKCSFIHYSINKLQKGFHKNFLDTISQCSGDVIFFSDQDDRWREDKVRIITSYFDNHPNIDVLFTNGRLIDEHGEYHGETMFERVGLDEKKQMLFRKGCALDILAWCNRTTGATMAIRKSLLQNIDWHEFDKIQGHDYLFTFLGLREGKLDFINDTLIDYRIHSNQTISLVPFEELFLPVEVPCTETNSWESVLKENQKAHCEFIRKRATFKYSCFGIKPIMHVISYMRTYGNEMWFRFFKYDYLISCRRSLHRVKHKLSFNKK